MTLSRKDFESYARIAIVADEPLIADFFLLLQQGVTIRCCIGCSIISFLREEIGADDAMIEKIQSIILDGKPVDDLESTMIHDGSTLAVSAAMPGLVGATLRRGGAYSSLRSAITYHETGEASVQGEGLVTIKIFNLLMAELGPGLLQKGVIINSENFICFAGEQSQEFWQGCRKISLDGEPIDAGELVNAARLSGNRPVILSVSSDIPGA